MSMTICDASVVRKLAGRVFAKVFVLSFVAGCNFNAGDSHSISRTDTSITPTNMSKSNQPVRPIGETNSSSPRIIGGIARADLRKFYPEDAKSRGIEGLVQIAVTLDAQGRATDTQILSESPLDMGFGAAASALAHTMTYSNPTDQKAVLDFNVRFAQSDSQMSSSLHRHRGHRYQ